MPTFQRGPITRNQIGNWSTGLGVVEEQHKAIPASSPDALAFGDMAKTFTGADIKVLIIRRDDPVLLKRASDYLNELAGTPVVEMKPDNTNGDTANFAAPTGQDVPIDKENNIPLVNLSAITVSTFRTKRQVRALGHVNPRGIARGNRTIGGTIILTEFDRDSFWKMISISDPVPGGDINIGDSGAAVLPDQIAPFDILLLFANEAGRMSYRMVYEIDIVTNGSVYSIQDMYSENTISFLCTDVTPLTPLPSVAADIWKDINGTQMRLDNSAKRVSPLAAVQSGKEVLKRYRMLKQSRDTNR